MSVPEWAGLVVTQDSSSVAWICRKVSQLLINIPNWHSLTTKTDTVSYNPALQHHTLRSLSLACCVTAAWKHGQYIVWDADLSSYYSSPPQLCVRFKWLDGGPRRRQGEQVIGLSTGGTHKRNKTLPSCSPYTWTSQKQDRCLLYCLFF